MYCWRALETWLYHEELRDLHHLYFLKPSHVYYHVSIIYPLLLLAVTCTQLIYIESYSPLYMCWFCILHMFIYVVLPTCFILRNQVYVCWFSHHICVCVFEPIVACVYLSGSFERLMDYSIMGECDVLWGSSQFQ